ncbi:hypothetical protein RU97_GL001114 [Enterococcus canis]|uniref:Uncharacterized protein n=1 Tax=Enterococcus canis TaxID=214095 RepID=A0A1L8RII4_9ENTE|nr:hypothetical protein [Enterococcus canis]OJG19543.1 hypothetical protein RU97_GL001114 [Enterococcus canis]
MLKRVIFKFEWVLLLGLGVLLSADLLYHLEDYLEGPDTLGGWARIVSLLILFVLVTLIAIHKWQQERVLQRYIHHFAFSKEELAVAAGIPDFEIFQLSDRLLIIGGSNRKRALQALHIKYGNL